MNSLKSSTITVHLFNANAHTVYDVLQTLVAEQVAIPVLTHWNEPKTFQDVPKNAKVATRFFVVPLRFVFSRKFLKFVQIFLSFPIFSDAEFFLQTVQAPKFLRTVHFPDLGYRLEIWNDFFTRKLGPSVNFFHE